MAAILRLVSEVMTGIKTQSQHVLEVLRSPKQRQETVDRLREFAMAYPRFSALLLLNILLSGPPLLLFTFFSLSVLMFTLFTAALVTIFSALFLTTLATGAALLFLLPTLFLTTSFASTTWFSSTLVYHALAYLNNGHSPVQRNTPIGDTLHYLTGGLLSWLQDTTSSSERGRPVQKRDVKRPSLSDASSGSGTDRASARKRATPRSSPRNSPRTSPRPLRRVPSDGGRVSPAFAQQGANGSVKRVNGISGVSRGSV